ncbi:MAG: amino acid synthesis family protein [Alphaproteobacteria bacterium]|nr:amino acid synthesis family protein [Alphaproteobacteria bacterium]
MPDLIHVRKIVVLVEEIMHDGGPPPATPGHKGAVAVVLRNPYAGKYVQDIMPMMEALKPVGLAMSRRLVAALGNNPKAVEAYGKGSIVGSAGEMEHGALWHVAGGYAMREVLGGAKAIVPSSTKLGAMGARIDIPIHHKDAAYVRSHFDAIEMGVTDAPKPDELVFILAMATGGRIHARAGGMTKEQISVGDGQR